MDILGCSTTNENPKNYFLRPKAQTTFELIMCAAKISIPFDLPLGLLKTMWANKEDKAFLFFMIILIVYILGILHSVIQTICAFHNRH
jgi:ABC-type dipeptide/oligopeptide/nickel transport system permease component